MTISANTEWEIRTTGAATNGSGFNDLNPGTSVDYSQQDAAELALADITTDGAGTGLGSATGGFTAAMEGNVIYLTGGGSWAGWYMITGHTDTNNITIDRSAGPSKSGVTGNVGGAYLFDATYNGSFFSSDMKGQYDIVHVKAGTYTGFGSTSLNIARTYMRMVGYNTSRNDQPTLDDRPLCDFGDNAAFFNWSGAYGWMEYIRTDQTYSSGTTNGFLASSVYFVMRNCKVTRSGYTDAQGCRISGDWGRILACEFVCTDGIAFMDQASDALYLGHSYIHDSKVGVDYSGGGSTGITVENCIIDTCSITGIRVFIGGWVLNNIIYNCGTGVIFASAGPVIVNCIVHTCTTGINGPEYTYDDNNIVYNCGTPRTGGNVAGVNSVTSDPLLVDPANQDFTYDSGSPAFNAAIKLDAAVGLP